MFTCFIISPIGESGSEIRKKADWLKNLIITPALKEFKFNVIRGDDISDTEKIDNQVLRQVQEADLCIIDLSQDNPNVYYEFGHREEAGKPFILLKAKGSDPLPVDVATQRYIEYAFDPDSIVEAVEKVQDAVKPFVEKGFESSGNGATIQGLAEILRRVERKIDRINKSSENTQIKHSVDINDNTNPYDLFKLAVIKQSIPMAEKAMNLLVDRVEPYSWLNNFVTQAADLGSIKAGDILLEKAVEFFDITESIDDKWYYFRCLTNNLYMTNREAENADLVLKLYEMLKAILRNESPEIIAALNYSLSRVCFGAFQTSNNTEWLEKAIDTIREGLKLNDENDNLHFMLACCLSKKEGDGNKEKALEHALLTIELEKKSNQHPSKGSLDLTCRIMHDLNDSRLEDYLDLLAELDKTRADLLRYEWKIS